MKTPETPLVSVVLAAHDAERFLDAAVRSVLRQTFAELELVVVDDASQDSTPELLAAYEDARIVVLRNDERKGLAASLNLALDHARGRYVARLDADDVAMPDRLERQLARIRGTDGVAVLGSAVCELGADGRLGAVHTMPASTLAVRWHCLFSSPFFHPTVLVDRELLEREGLRYDPSYLESEDYDLWARLLRVGEGANDVAPLVLYRVHPAQASQRRRDVQRSFQLEVARREIADVAPGLDPADVELAWRIGAGEQVSPEDAEQAVACFVQLVDAFEARHPAAREEVRRAAARAVLRSAVKADGARASLLKSAFELDVTVAVRACAARAGRVSQDRARRRQAERWVRALGNEEGVDALRVAAVFPEPTPYRAPLFDRLAELSELDLTVIYAAPTVADRTWKVELAHDAVFLRGLGVPGAQRVLHHDYPVTPGIAHALSNAQPDVVVVSGWSTFAAQGAIAWSKARNVPYVLVVESHDEGPRPGWRRGVKGTIVPPIVRGASSALVTGTLAQRSVVERGAQPERVRVFANTIDVEAFGERVDALAARRSELRAELGAGPDDVVVLSVSRLVPEKAHDVLVRAVAEADDPRLLLVLAGDGPERARLASLAAELDVRLVLAGDRPWDTIVEVYAAADVFALLSEREPWAVVVNEAGACGLPLVLSDRVGAGHDLLHDGENGVLVHAGDVAGAAAALRALASDPEARRRMGARSREIARDWGYAPSVANFLAAVREATNHRDRR